MKEDGFCTSCGERFDVGTDACPHCGASTSPPLLDAGAAVREYRIERKLGEGGMGEVYLALDTNTGRNVALKMVSPEFVRDPGIRRRFVEEARVMSLLRHPNVVSLYAFMEERGTLFLAMEYLDGPSLEQTLRRGRPALGEVVAISRSVLKALEYTHSRPQPIVHRDIKPGNVLLGTDGRICLTDFGVAKASGREKLTRTRGVPLKRSRCIGRPESGRKS